MSSPPLKGRTGLLEARWFKPRGFSLRSLASSTEFIAMKRALWTLRLSSPGTWCSGCSVVTQGDLGSLPVALAALTRTSAALGVGATWREVKVKWRGGRKRESSKRGGCCDVLNTRAGPTALLRRRFCSTALLSTALILSNPCMRKTGTVKKIEQKNPLCKGETT